MLTLAYLLTVHALGDFFLQSDTMAARKSKSFKWLFVHVSLYSIGFLWWGVPFAALTFALHFVTDAITSRITSKLWFFTQYPGMWIRTEDRDSTAVYVEALDSPWMPVPLKRHYFFLMIGLDQLIHVWCLMLTARLCGVV